jgi:hypothetical protein
MKAHQKKMGITTAISTNEISNTSYVVQPNPINKKMQNKKYNSK